MDKRSVAYAIEFGPQFTCESTRSKFNIQIFFSSGKTEIMLELRIRKKKQGNNKLYNQSIKQWIKERKEPPRKLHAISGNQSFNVISHFYNFDCNNLKASQKNIGKDILNKIF